ncbi:hypothetical protein EJD97_012708 [Solanum chilense]|uniref:Uncharacterized protein n=1 Tax=Solanum chilense TaxID=4083 RepID=A0A6N2BFT6_SOLCI|nr:hypothetical protein EJD97_012708 [Solanum chilense]
MTMNSPATRKITYNRGKGKVTFSIFVDSDYIDLFQAPVSSSKDPSDLPFGMLITHIFESHFMFLEDFILVLIKHRYNCRAFLSMGFTHFGYFWGLKIDSDDVGATPIKYKDSFSTYVSTTILNTTLENLVEMHNKLDIMAITIAQVSDLMTKLSSMNEQIDSLNDLLLSALFKIDNVKDLIKETGVDVARIRIKLY